MTSHLLHDRLTSFLIHLEQQDKADWEQSFIDEALETGGVFGFAFGHCCTAFPRQIWLHGVRICLSNGTDHCVDANEAIRAWIQAASARVEIFAFPGPPANHPPFGTPRNHGEEIANALAQRDTRPPSIRATDGRLDDPYNGQGLA